MKFIVDAQLPYNLSKFLIYKGFDSIHTLDIPNANQTQDDEIRAITIRESRILITKDSDF
jgi:predicted nuclease of predicted toxin-antitoxin system